MKIVNLNDVSFDEVIDVLKNDGLIIYPTETCYGVGCNPLSQKAVDKLFQYKARREGKAVSIAVPSIELAKKFVQLNETAQSFYERFLPGPFTIISSELRVPNYERLANGIASENGSVGVRIPDYKWVLELLQKYQNPITATSANQSYQKTPYKIQDILDNASKKSLELIDLVIDAGALPHNPPSTVIDTTLSEVQILRKGAFLPEGTKINEVISNSESETIDFGAKMLEKFQTNLEYRPLIFALQGDLGAGKTQFTKGIAKAMGITEQVQSPTFILSREYSAAQNILYHIDTWRLESDEDFEAIGFEQMLKQTSDIRYQTSMPQEIGKALSISEASEVCSLKSYDVVVIEWADKVLEYLRKLDVNHKIIWVEITADKNDENKRLIRWSE
jgi:L-threonylcarbamoyladenylate synthase